MTIATMDIHKEHGSHGSDTMYTVHKVRTAKIGYSLESLCKKMQKPFLQTPMIFLHAFVISILNVFVRISVEEVVS